MFAQRFGDAHLPQGAPRPDRHRRGHFSTSGIPRVESPQHTLVIGVDAAAGQLRDRGEPPPGDRLLAHAVLDRGNQLRIGGRREL